MRWSGRLVLVTAVCVLATACARDVTSPAVNAESQGELNLGLTPSFLACPTAVTHTGSATIGREGGTVEFGPHRLVVPRNALREPVTITGTAPAGAYVRAEMQPHGLEFRKKATLSLSVAHCGVLGLLPLRIVYVDDSFSILDVLPSVSDLLGGSVSAQLKHFSGYMVSH